MTTLLTSKLSRLRSRLRSLWLLVGGLRLAAEVALFLAVAFALDRALFLPSGVRVVVLLTALFALAARVLRLILVPLRKRVGTLDVALAVERKHREFDGGLASIVELTSRPGGPPPDVSPELLERWRADVERRGSAVRFEDVFDRRLLKRLALIDGGLALLLGGFAWTHPDESRIFAARLVGRDVDWPRRTHLVLDVAPADSPHYRVEHDDAGRATRVIVARGASLPVLVTAKGEVPEEVLLRVSESGRAGREEVRMAPREGARGEFLYRFRNALRPMELGAEGGDDPGLGPPLRVEVQPPPAVEKLVATITPPAYTRRSPTREERQEFAVPAGTRLDLEILTAGDVTEGAMTLKSDPATAQPLARDAANPALFRASLVVNETGTFNFHLSGRSGFKNLQPLDYPVTALADRKPTLEVARPGVSDLEATARAVVPFRLLVDDDYGVTHVELALARLGEKEGGVLVLQGEGSARPEELNTAGEPAALDAVLDLKDFALKRGDAPTPLREGDTLLYVATVRDNRESPPGTKAPNETSSPSRRIDVVSESEKTRKLADRELRLKQGVASAKKAEEDRLKSVSALLAAQGEGSIEARELSSLEVEQGRVTTSARQIARDFSDVSQEFVLNRLDAAPSAERALGFLLVRLGESKAGPAFDFKPFEELAAAHAAGEFGQLNQLGNVLAMLSLALEASERHAQHALEQIRGARLSGRPEDRLALLKGAGESERAVIETYAKLLDKMEEWEDFQEVLDLWKGLVNDQTQINQRARGGGAAQPPDRVNK